MQPTLTENEHASEEQFSKHEHSAWVNSLLLLLLSYFPPLIEMIYTDNKENSLF